MSLRKLLVLSSKLDPLNLTYIKLYDIANCANLIISDPKIDDINQLQIVRNSVTENALSNPN
jgi:hypothetical protein